jgi:hypothetical protein
MNFAVSIKIVSRPADSFAPARSTAQKHNDLVKLILPRGEGKIL